MKNGTSGKVIDHFNKVALLPDKWDHNQQYQEYMLKQIRKRCVIGLDIGCGTVQSVQGWPGKGKKE